MAFMSPNKTGEAGLAEVRSMLKELGENLEKGGLSLTKTNEYVSKLKLYGRSLETATPIFEAKSIEVLSRYALKNMGSVSQEAMRCVNNAFLLKEETRQIFVDQKHVPDVVGMLNGSDPDDQFLCARLLFLLTYKTDLDFAKLIEDHGLAEVIIKNINAYGKHGRAKRSKDQIDDRTMAISEHFQLIFNITHFFPSTIQQFDAAVVPITRILLDTELPSPPLQPPIAPLINVLLNLNLGTAAEEAPEGYVAPNAADSIHKLVQVLDKSTTSYSEDELEKIGMPLCTLLRRICEIVDDRLRSIMAALLLPSTEERDKPLGQGNTLAARLLRMSVSPLLPQLRENISNLLFELSHKDPDKFTQNVGFGYASGFLLSHGMVAPEGQTSNGTTITSNDEQINPVTGQRVSNQMSAPRSELPEMTEEEKEQEAERLFVLFERLKATGVIDVQNPVRRIYQGD